MLNLKIEFTDKEITALGGVTILQKTMEQMSFAEVLKNAPLAVYGSNRGCDPVQHNTQFIISIWLVLAGMSILKSPFLMVSYSRCLDLKSIAVVGLLSVIFKSFQWKTMLKSSAIGISGSLATWPLSTSHLIWK
jgi:hypothetical protein